LWLGARRRSYARVATPLEAPPRVRECCDPALLARVRVARVERIRNPIPARVRPAGMLDLSTVRAMAFIDTVVIADANQHATDDPASLLFHELVHVVQFDILGVRPFVAAYLRGWLDAGRSYLENPMEAMAFDLQARFDAGELSDVAREVRAALRDARLMPM
jgi:hypothetical protein